ncbi:hypothetical protein PUN28_004228 [Cardiocondyla obscurior]|uniref:Uncharacterized protein n=1 Tax=Cardiocondyla obscurior TaxID=286306 RepID=A0AAW2GQ66_9HYME
MIAAFFELCASPRMTNLDALSRRLVNTIYETNISSETYRAEAIIRVKKISPSLAQDIFSLVRLRKKDYRYVSIVIYCTILYVIMQLHDTHIRSHPPRMRSHRHTHTRLRVRHAHVRVGNAAATKIRSFARQLSRFRRLQRTPYLTRAIIYSS